MAAEQSAIADTSFASPPLRRSDGLRRIIKDVRNANYRGKVPRSCIVNGIESDSGDTLTIRFTGTLRLVDFCAGAILGNDKYQRMPATSAGTRGADIVVSDHPLSSLLLRRQGSFRIPTWVRQQLPIGKSWTDTLSALPSGLRKEIGRILRRHQYMVRISSGFHALRDYYGHLHEPYLRARFGNDAIIPSEAAFLSQSRGMDRLDLIHQDNVVAASLLERRGPRLAIRSSSMHPNIGELQGRADALDYFSLLIGQLIGCETLDFGLSRPHLDDGPFRYKAKWRTTLSQSGGLKSAIRIVPLKRSKATLAFLRRNYFLPWVDKRLFVRVLYDEHADLERLTRVATLGRIVGLPGVELAYDDRKTEPVIPPDSGLSLRPIGDPRDPLSVVIADR